jgi:hypothetical protein
VQDDVDARQAVLGGVLGDAPDRLAGHGGAHPLGQPPPALIRHLIDVTIRARQIAAAVNLKDKLPERSGPVSRGADLRHVEVE